MNEWEQWVQLLEVAVEARHSISVTEITSEADQQTPRVPSMMGNREEEPANWKVTSLLYISIGKTGPKMLMKKFPQINILRIHLVQLLQFCLECFQTRRNRTLDRHMFLSRKQKPTESLRLFWNILNGHAPKCDFGDQTGGLVYDFVVLNITKKQVQEKLCTEPKDNSTETLQLELDFKDGLRRQKTYGYIN